MRTKWAGALTKSQTCTDTYTLHTNNAPNAAGHSISTADRNAFRSHILVVAAAANLMNFCGIFLCICSETLSYRMSIKWIDRRRQISMTNMPYSFLIIIIIVKSIGLFQYIRCPFNFTQTIFWKMSERLFRFSSLFCVHGARCTMYTAHPVCFRIHWTKFLSVGRSIRYTNESMYFENQLTDNLL